MSKIYSKEFLINCMLLKLSYSIFTLANSFRCIQATAMVNFLSELFFYISAFT